MSDAPSPEAHRRLGRLVLGIAAVLAILFIGGAIWTRQYWMLAFLVLVIPNVYVGVRELRAARRG